MTVDPLQRYSNEAERDNLDFYDGLKSPEHQCLELWNKYLIGSAYNTQTVEPDKHHNHVGSMVAQRLRRWLNIKLLPSKQKTLNQCWFNVGPPFTTVDQR